ncbi:ctenidin-3-like [Dermacentor silvarum]|uniref:ctenidin-3-like n=1 Tax=Dermacentor silvarum TaxID=543639 RepID=UPI002100846E|nr:ctenidin-3-like [Dermacentor silvarum]
MLVPPQGHRVSTLRPHIDGNSWGYGGGHGAIILAGDGGGYGGGGHGGYSKVVPGPSFLVSTVHHVHKISHGGAIIGGYDLVSRGGGYGGGHGGGYGGGYGGYGGHGW